ncbi:TetR/AcrR family transcriptional regulator C-terminal domain-containing protein [Nocardioides sp. AX2bis]|uniref:TetR/AcrR family transcriptional regulator C-terminal domain-containing protein n=1 Tax=Nocardioides sp. AX2bis TaxID=2653157 RepID=UPI0012F3AA19|nr:TetR/AcrR family transcriptional regulator C-terminal domain-containing protein [Nocardioides sp. AX2bis]VXB81740.1 Tetracycline repressor protein class E [Nocardioides sp. AX2bis]
MAHRREDVVRTALAVLDAHGLADLTMRRLAAELDVRPSALYHHVPSKQVLLAAVADEVLRRGPRAEVVGPAATWPARLTDVCGGLREALLAYRDAAELVSTVVAFGLGADQPYADLLTVLDDAGLPDGLAPTAARTVLHFVLGHTLDEQTHLQAGAAGAIADAPRPGSDFGVGLGLVVDGIALRASVGRPGTPVRGEVDDRP